MTRIKTGGLTLSSILCLLPFLGAPMCGANIHDNKVVINVEEVNVGTGGEITDTGMTMTTDTGMLDTGDTGTPTTTTTGTPPIDADGDGVFSDTDCNDADASASVFSDWFIDADLDTFTGGLVVNTCGNGGDPTYLTAASIEPDCDDTSAAINPNAAEVCDGVDNDCDGSLDDLSDWYPDADGDGFGDELASATAACAAPLDSVADNTDCNDGDWEISPAVPENSSNGIDDNCDGIVDECAAGESRSTFVFDTESVACTDLVVSLQSFDPLDNQTFGEPLNATSTDIVDGLDNDGDGISDFNVMVLDAVLTVESLNCLPDEDTWYISGRYTMDGATHYSCEGDNIPVGEYVANGTMTLWQDGIEVPLEIVNNYDTPLTFGTGPGCEYGGAD